MRRVMVDDVLAAIPAGALVELCQDEKNADNANDQFIAATAFAPAAQGTSGAAALVLAETTEARLDKTMTPGSGWGGVGSYASSIEVVGDIVKTTIYVDLTGAKSSTTEDDIIGFDKGAERVINGTFTGDTNWTKPAGWAYGTNNMAASPTAGTKDLTPAVALVAAIGTTYEIVYTMSAFAAGTCTASFGGVTLTPRGSDATFTERVVAVSTAGLALTASALSNFTIDTVSIKEVKMAHLGQFTVADNGTLFDGEITWLETPATGVADIDFWSAPEASGAFDDPGKTDLTEVAVYAKGSAAAAARATPIALTALPAADDYLYMFGGAAGTAGTYSAGIFKMIFWGARPN